MHKEISMDSKHPRKAAALTAAIQSIDPGLKLCGMPGNSLLEVSDDLLTYLLSILRNEPPITPKASIDQWSDLLCVLKLHWILPLLYWRVGSLPPEVRPPESITDHMRMSFLESRVRILRSERQLGEILDAFQGEGVRALVLRGPALAWSVYPNPALRPGSDLDLLVLPEQIIQARAILEHLGYKCLSKRFEETKDFFREEDFIHRTNPRDNLVVDLHWVHWELHPFFGISRDVGIEDLFRRALKVKSSSLTFATLHPVDALINAAIHMAMIHNRDMRLIWICDIALLARQLRIPEDWELLQERSVAWSARLAVENSLKIAQAWTGLKLPEKFSDFSSWPQPTEEELATWSHTMRRHWVSLMLKRYLSRPSGLREMLRSLFGLLFPHPDIVRYCYPPCRDWLLPLSYVRRWHRWFMELIVKRNGSPRRRVYEK